MNILIVEDAKDKQQNIERAIHRIKPAENCNIEVAKTYFSAKNKIILLKKKISFDCSRYVSPRCKG